MRLITYMHGEADDMEVIRMVLQGQRSAYATIVTRYEQYVFTLAMRYVNNRETAEELAQDVFVKAYRYLADFKGNSKFSTWLYAIVHTTCLSHLRKKKENSILLEEDRMAAVTDDRLSEPPANRMEQRMQAQVLADAMKRLPVDDAQLLTLYYYGEQSVEEIGMILGLTASNVKVRLFRARQKLREILMPVVKEVYE